MINIDKTGLASDPALLDVEPTYIVGMSALMGSLWVFMQMFWSPYNGFFYGATNFHADTRIVPIYDYAFRFLENWYKACYFFSWVVYFLGSFVQFMAFLLAESSIDASVFGLWTYWVSYYMLCYGAALPWLLMLFYLGTEHWFEVRGNVQWNILGGMLVHILSFIPNYEYRDRVYAWAMAS
jgi:hypothetical protein